MIDFFSGIRGDFSLSAISIRLYAPDPKSLFKHMPDANPEQSLENWENFGKKIDWHFEMQSILYVANFVHEFVHLLQHTTLLQCMHQVDFFHNITRSILGYLQEIKGESNNWPPKIPLLNWLANSEGEEAREIFDLCHLCNIIYSLYLGNEDFAQHYCESLKKEVKEIFIEPFNPRISSLDSNIKEFDQVPITTTMLLESQATMLAYRFVASFYGTNFANRLVLGDGSDQPKIREDYDILSLIAVADGLLYLTPLIIDWALDGSAYFNYKEKNADYSYLHPTWRFAKLYRAAKEFKNRHNLSNLDLFGRLKDILELKREIFRIAKMEIDDPDYLITWINQLKNEMIRKIFQRNIELKLEHPEVYAYFESNFALIGSKTYIPLTFFRDNAYHNFHTSTYQPEHDILDAEILSRFTRRAFELDRMIEGVIPKCPFCQGLEYELKDGKKVKRYPPAGQRGIITKDVIVSENCHCGWEHEFKEFWGVTPEQIEFLN